MSEQQGNPKDGIEVDALTFDSNGEVAGLGDDVLNEIAGGIAQEETDTNNTGCGNSANVSCSTLEA